MSRGRANPISSRRPNYLVDTDVFILWQHNNQAARRFLRRPPGPIYYSKQTRKEGDALIAATALVKNLALVTGNARHFEPIKEIKVIKFPERLNN